MKHKIFKSKSDAEKAQHEDDLAAGLPRPGRYIDGSPAPAGHGETHHQHDVREHPKGKLWAYAASENQWGGRADPDAEIVDALPTDWTPDDERKRGKESVDQ